MPAKLNRGQLMATTIIAGAFLVAGSVQAQTVGGSSDNTNNPAIGPVEAHTEAPASADAGGTNAGEIVVTGSRITSPNLQSASPINAVSGKELLLTGATRAEDLVNQLPQAFASQNSGIANGSDGTATLDLRQLGDTRTLVLLNGHRLAPGDPSRLAGGTLGSAADINNVPAFLVKRVDVLTGGASAAYGADAVAGVVNFILDTDFTGFKLDGSTGLFVHNNNSQYQQSIIASGPIYPNPHGNTNDGATYDVSLGYGMKLGGGRGHVAIFGSYHQQDAVVQSARDYSACGFTNSAAPTSRGDNFRCSGSRNSAGANFITDNGIGDTGAGLFIVDKNTGQPRDFEDSDRYNYQPNFHYQRPDTRYNAGLFAHYDVSDAFKPYIDFTYMNDKSSAQIAPSGTFGNIFTINCSNPLLAPNNYAVATALGCGTVGPGSLETVGTSVFKRNVEGGPRVDDLRHEDFRVLGGFKGDLGRAWSYDANAQISKVNYKETYLNDFSFSRTRLAINDCLNPDGSAVADTSCVPYNIFTGSTGLVPTTAQGVTQNAINYVQQEGHKSGYTQEIDAQLIFNGRLGEYGIQSPLAESGVDVAIGGEYRRQSLKLNTDVEFSTGDLLGQGAETKPASGHYDVKEGFVEINAPLVEGKTAFQMLSVDGAYRYSSYSSIGHTNTWKISAIWQPFAGTLSGLKFRGSINRAVRAPTLQDLYAPRQLGLEGSLDTCAENPGDPTLLAGCLNTARNDPNFAAHYPFLVANPASQYNGQTAGAQAQGTSLKPEVAITKTVGAVFAPTEGFLRGFSASVDYYHINLRDSIRTDGYNTIFNQCFDTGSDYYCSLVKRNPANGSLWLGTGGYIIDPVYNAGRLRNSGIDVDVSYAMRPQRWGALSASFTGSYLLHEKVEELTHNPDGSLTSRGFYECAGFYGDSCGDGGENGPPSPRWRHRLRVTWASPNDVIEVSGNWRFIGGTKPDSGSTNPINPDIGAEGSGKYDRIKAYNYLDMVVTFNVDKRFSFRVGANNILDKDPPIIDGVDYGNTQVSGNTFPGAYDQLGRYVFAGVSAKF